MRLEFTGRHVPISAGARKLVEEKLGKLDRKLNRAGVSAQVVLTLDRNRLTAEVTLHARGEKFLHGVSTARDVERALLDALGKLDQQAAKIKGKWQERKRRGAVEGPRAVAAAAEQALAPAEEDEVRVIRARRYAVKPMSVEEAALEVGDAPDAFIVFRNATSETINVLFRRKDGHLGLIEPEA